MLAAQKCAVEIDRQHAAPDDKVGVLDRADSDDAGGVDETIEAAGAALDSIDDPCPVGFGGHVERMIDAVAAEIAGDRGAAMLHHRVSDGGADRAGGAGHQHDLPIKPTHGHCPC